MVIYDNYTTKSGVERVLAYSNKSVYIERDGAEYASADDFAYQNRKYIETDNPIEGDTIAEAEQKSAAYDYLTGRNSADD